MNIGAGLVQEEPLSCHGGVAGVSRAQSHYVEALTLQNGSTRVIIDAASAKEEPQSGGVSGAQSDSLKALLAQTVSKTMAGPAQGVSQPQRDVSKKLEKGECSTNTEKGGCSKSHKKRGCSKNPLDEAKLYLTGVCPVVMARMPL